MGKIHLTHTEQVRRMTATNKKFSKELEEAKSIYEIGGRSFYEHALALKDIADGYFNELFGDNGINPSEICDVANMVQLLEVNGLELPENN